MQIKSIINIWQDGTQYIAHAMPIDVASSGPTPEAARTALDEAIDLFISTARDAGTLDKILENVGL